LIAYFDTSSIVPLLIDEPGSETAKRLWDEAALIISTRLLYAECRSALAMSARLERLNRRRLRTAVELFNDLYAQIDVVEISDHVVRRAAEFSEIHGLRGYDAVHLAAAETIGDDDLVLVAGDGPLCRAGEAIGMAIART